MLSSTLKCMYLHCTVRRRIQFVYSWLTQKLDLNGHWKTGACNEWFISESNLDGFTGRVHAHQSRDAGSSIKVRRGIFLRCLINLWFPHRIKCSNLPYVGEARVVSIASTGDKGRTPQTCTVSDRLEGPPTITNWYIHRTRTTYCTVYTPLKYIVSCTTSIKTVWRSPFFQNGKILHFVKEVP